MATALLCVTVTAPTTAELRRRRDEVGDADLVEHAHFLYDAPESRLWCMAYSAVSDAPLVLQQEEVLEARFISVEQALEETHRLSYCPDSLAALERYIGRHRQA